MYYTEWVEKIWRAICTEAEQGSYGRTWSPLISDSMLEALGVSDLSMLPSEKQHELLWGIDQAGALLQEKGLFLIRSRPQHGIELTPRGQTLVGKSPLPLWPPIDFAEHQVTFLSSIAQKQVVTGPDDVYMYVPHNPSIAAKALFKELSWTYSRKDFDSVTGKLIAHALISNMDTMGDHKLRLTPKGALYAARLLEG